VCYYYCICMLFVGMVLKSFLLCSEYGMFMSWNYFVILLTSFSVHVKVAHLIFKFLV
jgi:hypothetical protein